MTADAPYDFPYEEVPEETRPEVLRRYWGIAKGLQAVDGLESSERLFANPTLLRNVSSEKALQK